MKSIVNLLKERCKVSLHSLYLFNYPRRLHLGFRPLLLISERDLPFGLLRVGTVPHSTLLKGENELLTVAQCVRWRADLIIVGIVLVLLFDQTERLIHGQNLLLLLGVTPENVTILRDPRRYRLRGILTLLQMPYCGKGVGICVHDRFEGFN